METIPTFTSLLSPPETGPDQQVTEPVRQAQQLSPMQLPAITTSRSREYAQACALATTRASIDDPLLRVFHAEAFKSSSYDCASQEEYRQLMYDATLDRALLMISTGAFVVEAGDFAAMAVWEPAAATQPPQSSEELAAMALARPHFGNFLANLEDAKSRYLYPLSQRYWHLTLMARDPTVPYVPGAVRAIMVPFLQKAVEEDRVPVWLEARHAKARDMYAHFGFQEVASITVDGCPPTFCMIYTEGLVAAVTPSGPEDT